MAASRLQFSCNRTNRRARRRLVSLPPWRCCLVIYAQVPAASRTFVWLFTRLPDENSSGHGRDSSADLLQLDETEGDMVNCHHSSWAMLLAYIIIKLTVAPKPLAGLPYDDFISSGLRALYRSPLRGLQISPARRAKGSCKCVRSWNC